MPVSGLQPMSIQDNPDIAYNRNAYLFSELMISRMILITKYGCILKV